MQALTLPMRKYPSKKGEEHLGMMDHPALEQLRHEVMISSIFLVTVPAVTYFSVRIGLKDFFYPDEALYAGFACLISIWVVIVVIIIVKYKEDFIEVFEGRGGVPYDKSIQPALDYFRSDEYIQAERDREEREENQRDKL